MAIFLSTADLKRDTNQILKGIEKEPAVITRHGHPCAALIPLPEQGLEELLWEFSPKVQHRIKRGIREMKAGKGIGLKEFAKKYGLL